MNNQQFMEAVQKLPKENVFLITEKNPEIIRALNALRGNRPIRQNKVSSLVKAFGQGLYIPPILVAMPSREITEGNHRIAAANECLNLGISFQLRLYFYKDSNALATARLINNTQLGWDSNDRLHSFISSNVPAYVTLKKFMDNYKEILCNGNHYAISSTLELLSNGRALSSMQRNFIAGTLKIEASDIIHAQTLLTELSAIANILNTNAVYVRHHTLAWDKARTRLGISFDKFLTKLKRKANKWEEPKDSMNSWFTMYLEIAGI